MAFHTITQLAGMDALVGRLGADSSVLGVSPNGD